MEKEFKNNLKISYYSAVSLSVITLITFAFAMMAIPISGAFCPSDCIEYPYLDTLSQFPGDYIWMFLATLMILTYLIFTLFVHSFALKEHKIYSHINRLAGINDQWLSNRYRF
jgi:hypothetical protein